ncbi:hypothetical protein [Actinomadura welshii]|uniref:hypothetical protein n=1 Tax=Actinomadura welshii TaxID=3103817 RepID=UPI0003ACEEB6|nr:hypothetical protein [Actinomadura madurae]
MFDLVVDVLFAGRSGNRSIEITRSAPSSIAARAAICPTAPQPHTATTSPGRTPPRSAPIQPVGAESEANSALMSFTPSGTGKAP